MLIEEGIEGEYQLLRCILKLTPVYHHIFFSFSVSSLNALSLNKESFHKGN